MINSKTIPQFWTLNTWHQWRNTGRIVVTQYFLASFGHPFDHVLFKFWPQTFSIELYELYEKKHRKIGDCDYGVQFFLKPITFGNELRTFDKILKVSRDTSFPMKTHFSYPTTTTRHRRIPEECGSLLRQRPNTKSWSAIIQRTEMTKRTSSSKQNFQVSNQNAHFSEPYNSGTAGQ